MRKSIIPFRSVVAPTPHRSNGRDVAPTIPLWQRRSTRPPPSHLPAPPSPFPSIPPPPQGYCRRVTDLLGLMRAGRRTGKRCAPQRLLWIFLGVVVAVWVTTVVVWSGRWKASGEDRDRGGYGRAPRTAVVRGDATVHEPSGGERSSEVVRGDATVHEPSGGERPSEDDAPTKRRAETDAEEMRVVTEAEVSVTVPVLSTLPSSRLHSIATMSPPPLSKWARVFEDTTRRGRVKAAMKGAFGAYGRLASVHDELAPVSGTGRDDFGGIGALPNTPCLTPRVLHARHYTPNSLKPLLSFASLPQNP
jgi:hypothetical protein